ncbi:MAG TPA: ABC transporter permease [Clostridia bacterium]|nr:ABC transporter permease [Clostridia bacterium]
MNTNLLNQIKKTSWIWAFLGSLVIWAAISILTRQFGLGSLFANASLASLLVIVSIGQMFAITSGDGGIDLSIPYVITLSAFLSFGLINGSESNLFMALAVVLGIGLLVGVLNSVTVLLFKIPPMIATMAVGYILNSAILIYSESYNFAAMSKIITYIANGRIAGIPFILIFALFAVLVIAFILNSTSYGRSLSAVGQNRFAAYLAGIQVNKTVMIAYMVSGLFAAIAGVLIGARVNGAFLDMGQPYMLQSVSAVVIGGTLISGGKASVVGTALGSLFLILLSTLMMVTHLPIGAQYVIQGILLIAVLVFDVNTKNCD